MSLSRNQPVLNLVSEQPMLYLKHGSENWQELAHFNHAPVHITLDNSAQKC